jgi:hypothetical protein
MKYFTKCAMLMQVYENHEATMGRNMQIGWSQ